MLDFDVSRWWNYGFFTSAGGGIMPDWFLYTKAYMKILL